MPAHYDILKNTEIYLTNVRKRPLLIYYSFSNRQQRCEPVINKMWGKSCLTFFSLNFNDIFRSTGCGKGTRIFMIFKDRFYLKLTFWSVYHFFYIRGHNFMISKKKKKKKKITGK